MYVLDITFRTVLQNSQVKVRCRASVGKRFSKMGTGFLGFSALGSFGV